MPLVKLPHDSIIPSEKLVRYLLVPRRKNDKSGFLVQAGFYLDNAHLLEQAIRELISENDAIPDRQNEYGTFYQVEGELRGPEGALLTVTVWIQLAEQEHYRFITLKPAR